jgi:hypothetical protein
LLGPLQGLDVFWRREWWSNINMRQHFQYQPDSRSKQEATELVKLNTIIFIWIIEPPLGVEISN